MGVRDYVQYSLVLFFVQSLQAAGGLLNFDKSQIKLNQEISQVQDPLSSVVKEKNSFFSALGSNFISVSSGRNGTV